MATSARSHRVTFIAALLAVPVLACAQETESPAPQPAPQPAPADGLPGMVRFAANPAQPMGMDEAAIKSFLTKDLGRDLAKWERFEFVWSKGFLFLTPRHTQPHADVFLARHEVTNAQWKVFLDAPVNQAKGTTSAGMTLISLARFLYDIEEEIGPNVQRAWLYLYELNEEILAPVLNPDGAADFNPLMAQAGDASLPSGLELRYSVLQPPPYWRGASPPDDELDRPVRYVSWADAREFCRWAGLHLPLEVEWEAAARGPDAARRFPWGDDWNVKAIVWKRWQDPNPGRPEAVESHPAGATPDGLHHMLGNVSEYVFDLARPYPGSKVEFPFTGAGVLARGGNYEDEDYLMLAADRVWDIGPNQISPQTRADGFGFRLAAYPSAARELCLELATYGAETNRARGAYLWCPYPPGLSKKDLEKTEKRLVLQGFALDRAAGWIERDLAPDAANHAYVRGPAKGIALLPLKGLAATELKASGDLAKLAADPEITLFVGALVSTAGCHIDLTDAEGVNRRRVHLGGAPEFHVLHDLRFRYQVGAWLVLRGDKIAVYPGNGSAAGVHGAHLRAEPLGYLPGGWTESVRWVDTAEARPTATFGPAKPREKAPKKAGEKPGGKPNGKPGGKPAEDAAPAGPVAPHEATLTLVLPQIDPKDGEVKKSGKSAVLEITVPIEFATE